MLKVVICSAALLASGYALAEETTVIRRESTPGVGVVVTPPAVERRSTTVTTGCDTTVVHKENDLGESKTVKKTDC